MNGNTNVLHKAILPSLIVGNVLFSMRYPDHAVIGVVGVVVVLFVGWYTAKKNTNQRDTKTITLPYSVKGNKQ